MRKRDELIRGCMAKARDDELTFVLLGRDRAAPATIRFWISERIRLGKNRPGDMQIVEAEQCARTMEAERDAGAAAADLKRKERLMPETQESVCRWIDETFPGADPESPRKSLRALEEMVELCFASGASHDDVYVTIERASDALRKSTGREYMEHRPEPAKVPAEAADVLIVLYGLAGLRGFDLHVEVDKKMSINRARRWATRGDGTGYHIKEGS